MSILCPRLGGSGKRLTLMVWITLVSSQTVGAQAPCTPSELPPAVDLAIGPLELSIGSDEAPLFRVTSGLITSDTSIIVANAGTSEILRFDTTGSLTQRLGGPGGGPHEFSALGPAYVSEGDVVVATDRVAAKVVLFDLVTGKTRAIAFRGERVQTIYPLPDARWLVYSTREGRPRPTGGRFRGAAELVLYDRSGTHARRVLSVAGIDLYDHVSERGGGMRGFPPFPRRTLIGVDQRGCIWVNDGESAILHVYDLNGKRRASLRVAEAEREPVTRDEWSARIDVMLGRVRDPAFRPRMRRVLEGIPFNSHRPPFGALTIDDHGRLWLASYHHADEDVDGWWVVSEGGSVSWVDAPRGSRRLLDVRGGHALILAMDQFDAETVGLFEISRR